MRIIESKVALYGYYLPASAKNQLKVGRDVKLKQLPRWPEIYPRIKGTKVKMRTET